MNKKCFVISPIGKKGSETRKRSDFVLENIIEPITKKFRYETKRVPFSESGIINTKIIERLINANLVIADLTDSNPNVFYELGVRHTVNKPTIQIIKEGQKIPFDVSPIQAIFLNIDDTDSINECKEELKKQIQSIINNPNDIISFVSYALPNINFLNMQKKLGITAIYEYGNTENEKISTKLKNANEIKIIALSARSFFHNFGSFIIEALIKKNATIKVLFAKEYSETVEDVESVESEYRKGHISQEIESTKDQLKEILTKAKGKGQIWYGQYRVLIRNSITICDKNWGWLTLIYPPKRAVESLTLELGMGKLLEDCKIHFDKVWNLSSTNKYKIKYKIKK